MPRRLPPPRAGSSSCTPSRCTVITDLEELAGVAVRRIHGDKGYRGHNYPGRFKVWISGQVRRVTKAICREMLHRAAIEPVISHLKDDHRRRRNHLKGRHGDRINAVLAAAGHNFSLLLRGGFHYYGLIAFHLHCLLSLKQTIGIFPAADIYGARWHCRHGIGRCSTLPDDVMKRYRDPSCGTRSRTRAISQSAMVAYQ